MRCPPPGGLVLLGGLAVEQLGQGGIHIGVLRCRGGLTSRGRGRVVEIDVRLRRAIDNQLVAGGDVGCHDLRDGAVTQTRGHGIHIVFSLPTHQMSLERCNPIETLQAFRWPGGVGSFKASPNTAVVRARPSVANPSHPREGSQQ